MAAAVCMTVSVFPPTALAATDVIAPASDVVLSGTLSGADALSNVPVRLFVLGTEAELARTRTQPHLTADKVATVRTDRTGRFSVPQSALKRTDLPTQSERFDVAVIAGELDGEFSVVETTMVYDAAAGTMTIAPEIAQGATDLDHTTTTAMVPEPGSRPVPLPPRDVEGAEPSETLTVNATGVPHVRMALTNGLDVAATDGLAVEDFSVDAAPTAVDGITTTRVATYRGILTYVGSIHATTNGYSASFSTARTAHASLGSAVNAGGGWTAGGTISRSMGVTTTWGGRTTAGNWVLGTYYSAAKYKNTVCERGACAVYYTVKGDTHEGGAVSGTAAAPSATYCRPYQKNNSIKLDRNSATTWNAGLKISKIVGFDATSRAGYSTSESLTIRAEANRAFCGTNTYPANHPARIVVKP